MSSIQAYKAGTQTRRNYSSTNTVVSKAGAQTRGIFEFPSIPTSVLRQFFI